LYLRTLLVQGAQCNTSGAGAGYAAGNEAGGARRSDCAGPESLPRTTFTHAVGSVVRHSVNFALLLANLSRVRARKILQFAPV
jgi:hypothetical protein